MAHSALTVVMYQGVVRYTRVVRYLPSHHTTHFALTVVTHQRVVRYLPCHHVTHSTLTVVTYQGVVKYSTQGYFDQENFLTSFTRRVDNALRVP